MVLKICDGIGARIMRRWVAVGVAVGTIAALAWRPVIAAVPDSFDRIDFIETDGNQCADAGVYPVCRSVAKLETIQISNVDRPQVASVMTAVLKGADRYRWKRRSLSGSVDTVAEGADYTPVANDFEHWLKVEAVSNNVIIGEREFYFSKLPVVYLNTDGGVAVTDKVNYVQGTMRVQGNAEFAEQYNGKIEVKGRGNSSWEYFPQKPYKLKLDKKTNMFGFGKNKHWVLVSDYADNALMRNKHGSELAKELGIVGMDMTWVTVILNGVYYGVEMFVEHIRIDDNRVKIYDWESKAEEIAGGLFDAVGDTAGWSEDDLSALEEKLSSDFSWISSSNVVYKGTKYRLADYGLWEDWDLSGGYLYEMDGRWDEVSKFQAKQKLTKINISKPEFAGTDKAMFAAAQKVWNDFESAYLSVDHYSADGKEPIGDLADVDSMVAYWLALECLGNVDARAFSRYSYIDVDGKLKFGPVWDFDHGGGSIAVANDSYGVIANPDHWAICCFGNGTKGSFPGSDFYCEWLDDPVFASKAYEVYWQKVRPWMAAELASGGGMDQKVAYLTEAGDAHDMKYKRWGFNGKDGDVAKYRQYLTKRMAWLDKQFASVNGLMASVRNTTSAHPYDKRDDIIGFLFEGGVATNVVCNTDFAVVAEDGQLKVSATIKTNVAAKACWYLNGLKRGSAAVVDGAAATTIAVDGVEPVATNRYLVSLIVRDDEEKVVARNYATVMMTAAKTPAVRTLTGELPEGTNLTLTAAETIVLDGVRADGPLVFGGAFPLTLELAEGSENEAVQVRAEGEVRFVGEGALTIRSTNDLLKAGGDVVVSNGVITLDFAAGEEKDAAVMMVGNYRQHGGKVTLNMTGDKQAYGFRWKDVKKVEATIDGGEFAAKVASGEGSAAFKANKGSNNFTVEGDGVLKAKLEPVDARVVDVAGKIKFKDEAKVEVEGKKSATHARVFKSEEEVSVADDAVVIAEVPGEGSEIFSSDLAIEIKGGVCNLTAADDCLSAGADIAISGGKLQCLSTEGDAIDANGSVTVSGGWVFATTCAKDGLGIDVGEGEKVKDEGEGEQWSGDSRRLVVDGGWVVAVGGAGRMCEIEGEARCYTNANVGTLKKYLVLTSQYTDRVERVSVNLAASEKRNADGFSLIAAVPNMVGEYTETDTKPSKDSPKGEKLDDNLDGVFVTTIPDGVATGAAIELEAEDEESAKSAAEAKAVVLSHEDVAAGVETKYLRMKAVAFTNGAGKVRYRAEVGVNSITVHAPVACWMQVKGEGQGQGGEEKVKGEGQGQGGEEKVEGEGQGQEWNEISGAGMEVEIGVTNAVKGLWYGCEVRGELRVEKLRVESERSLGVEKWVDDVASFERSTGKEHKVKGKKRTEASGFYRVKVTAAKPE